MRSPVSYSREQDLPGTSRNQLRGRPSIFGREKLSTFKLNRPSQEQNSRHLKHSASMVLRDKENDSEQHKKTKKSKLRGTLRSRPATLKPNPNRFAALKSASSKNNAIRGSKITSLRRSIRSTLSPPAPAKKASETYSSSFGFKTNSETSLLSYDTPSRGSKPSRIDTTQMSPRLLATPVTLGFNNPSPTTPKAILRDQLEMTVDESLLVSPTSQNTSSFLRLADERLSITKDSNIGRHQKPTIIIKSTFVESLNLLAARSRFVFEQKPDPAIDGSKMNTALLEPDIMAIPTSLKQSSGHESDRINATPSLQHQSMETFEPLPAVHTAKKSDSAASAIFVTPMSSKRNDACMNPSSLLCNEQSTTKPRTANRQSIPNEALTVKRRTRARAHVEEDDWADSQCEQFLAWLNFVLCPNEDCETQLVPCRNDNCIVEKQPGNYFNQPALRILYLHQHMSSARAAASRLLKSEDMQGIISIIDAEVAKGNLAIRSDRDMCGDYADLTLRRTILSLLFSYSMPWLQLGLETLFGVVIEPELITSCSAVVKVASTPANKGAGVNTQQNLMGAALRSFIVNRVLSDTATLDKYTKGRCKMPSGNFETRYRKELRVLVLRRVLALIFLLDRLGSQAGHLKTRKLFSKSSHVKSSRQVLEQLCRHFLAQEGDITKHLRRLGLKVIYKQQNIDEIEFSITNFAVDLRDGVRLARLAEILTGARKNSLLQKLRVPAVSRLQKLHNVGLALSAWRNAGVTLCEDVSPHHIVDGQRSAVFKLIRIIVSHFCSRTVFDHGQVENEVVKLLGEEPTKRPVLSKALSTLDSCDNQTENRGRTLLFSWCHAVCSRYRLPISDFSSSFADGKALCLMIHHYHPYMLSLDEIRPTTMDFDGQKPLTLDDALRNERLNNTLAHRRLLELGGIPGMAPTSDTTHPPDEKSLVAYLSYSCSRLLASQDEVRACKLIQNCYRRHRRRRLVVQRLKAAGFIGTTWQRHREKYFHNQRKKYGWAVRTIESLVRSRRHSLVRMKEARVRVEIRQESAVKIQNQFRRFRAQNSFHLLKTRHAIAANVRKQFVQMKAHHEEENRRRTETAAIRLQSTWRRYSKRKEFVATLKSALLIQKLVRKVGAREKFCLAQKGAIRIQSIWRAFWFQMQFQVQILDIIAIQTIIRSKLAVAAKETKFQALLVLQRSVRRFLATRRSQRMRRVRNRFRHFDKSAILCQASIRMFRVRQKRMYATSAAAKIQKLWRSARDARCADEDVDEECISSTKSPKRKGETENAGAALEEDSHSLTQLYPSEDHDAKLRKHAVRMLQRFAGQCLSRGLINRVTLLQAFVRGHLIQMAVIRAKVATLHIQKAWRASHQVNAFKLMKTSALTLQRFWRRCKTRRTLMPIINAASPILKVEELQTTAGLLLNISLGASLIDDDIVAGNFSQEESRLYLDNTLEMIHDPHRSTNGCAITIQRYWRGFVAIRHFHSSTTAAVSLQAFYRGSRRRLQMQQLHISATKIQSKWRAHLSNHQYQKTFGAIVSWQTCARMWLAKRLLSKARMASVCIQKHWRSSICRPRFNKDLISIVKCQYYARRWLSNRRFLMAWSAALCIQKIWRGYIGHASYRADLLAVVKCQSYLRRWQASSRLSLAKRAAICIQKNWRSFVCNVGFHMDLMDIVLCQSLVRSWLAKRRLCLANQKLVVSSPEIAMVFVSDPVDENVHLQPVQSRGAPEDGTCFDCNNAACDVDVKGISIPQSQAENQFHLAAEKSAVCIQKHWRGFACNVGFKMDLMDIVQCQSLVRRWLVKKRLSLDQQAVILAHKKLVAVVQLQSFGRRWLANRQIYRVHQAALCIQRHWRGFVYSIGFQMDLLDIVRCQSYIRRWLAKKRFDSLQQATICIQRHWRGFVCNIGFQMGLLDIVRFQSLARTWLARKRFYRVQQAAVCIQKQWRGLVCSINYHMDLMNIVQCQCIVRRWLVRQHSSSSTLRSLPRETSRNQGTLLRVAEHGNKGRDRNNKRERAACIIQKCWRCYTVHVEYFIALLGVMALQANCRRAIAKRRYQSALQSIVSFQALYRGYHVRRLALEQNQLLRTVHQSIRKELRSRDEPATISTRVAPVLPRSGQGCIDRSTTAAILIQKVWRGHSASFMYQIVIFCTLQIQRVVRGFLAKKEIASQRRTNVLRAPDTLARAAGILTDTSNISWEALPWISGRVVVLQSLVRGHLIRKARRKQLCGIAARLKTQHSPNMQLGARTASALAVIGTRTSLSEIMAAVRNLEATTRLSRGAAIAVVKGNTTAILLSLIRACNQSRPHQEILIYLLSILKNVSRHKDLLPFIATTEVAEVMIDLVQVFRSKQEVFCLSVSLLEICIKRKENKLLCQSQENLKRLKAVNKLCNRKQLSTIGRGTMMNAPGEMSNCSNTLQIAMPVGPNSFYAEGAEALRRIILIAEEALRYSNR
ncbi:Abnormal spindle-like microcephaly-associated protein homolog (Fragment) [Seminavis robusta]|uniref:Abnormal spindle-like microcephaly-associated protein homolog n=1 Tax=Seminavis robusta TaxID=568900 RepID=A0A9N8DVY5_9STRA